MHWITRVMVYYKVHYPLSVRCHPQYRWHKISSGFCFLIWKLSNLLKSISMNNTRRGVGRSESIRRAWKLWTVPSYCWVSAQAVHKGLGCLYIKREVALHKTWYEDQIFWLKLDYNCKVSHLPSPGTGQWNRSGRGCIYCPSFALSFLDSSEHTCGTEAQKSINSSGIRTQDLQYLCTLGRQAHNKLSHPLLLVERIKGKNSTHLKNLRKPLVSHTVNTITGHDAFIYHFALMKLTDEPSCPKCCTNTDSNIQFIFAHFLLQRDQKKVTNVQSKQNNQNQLCITVNDLAGYIKLSDIC